MSHEEFLDTVWRLEEVLTHLDYIRAQIDKCPDKCDGLDAEEEGLCPTCADWFAQVLAEEERLGHDKEFSDVMDKLRQVCQEDKTGRYQRILDQARQGKVIH